MTDKDLETFEMLFAKKSAAQKILEDPGGSDGEGLFAIDSEKNRDCRG